MGTFQYRVEWDGTTGGPGVSVFNFRLSGAALTTGPQQAADNIRTFFQSVASGLPNELVLSFPAEVTELDTVTGQLTAVHPVTPGAPIPGGSTGGYAHASGVRIEWLTGSILNGRRLKGTTFLVPYAAGAFDVNGRLPAASVAPLEDAAEAYVQGMENIGSAAVWSRTHGILADVTSIRVPTLGAVLRSRRD